MLRICLTWRVYLLSMISFVVFSIKSYCKFEIVFYYSYVNYRLCLICPSHKDVKSTFEFLSVLTQKGPQPVDWWPQSNNEA